MAYDEAKIVLVTGANNGIGFHMTRTLLAGGYRVAAVDLNVENLQSLQTVYPDLFYRQCDITVEEQVDGAVRELLEHWGRIDILVNNACLAIFKPFQDRTIMETRSEFEVNYFGAYRMIQAVLPAMLAEGSGLIHNLSSGVGLTGFSGIPGYTSTKGAIEALTRTLAIELAPHNIVVNLMHPPLTNTRSAAPLGIPAEVMADPAKVGAQLARQILSTKPNITPDFQTAAYLFFCRRFPLSIGKFMSKMAERGRKQSTPR